MTWEPSGKVAVVTGASSGIGEATVRRLAGVGMTVVAVARREDRLAALAAEDERVIAHAADVTAIDQVDRLARRVRDDLGACHTLVNNAGLSGGRLSGRGDLDETLYTIDVNLLGAVRCTAAFADLLAESAPSRVVNVASIAGKLGVGLPGYSASKFGMVGFSEALGHAWADRGVTVCQLNPGFVATEGFPQTRLRQSAARRIVVGPELVADAILEVLTSGATERTVPRWYRAAITLRHLAPPLYRALASRGARRYRRR
jgi:short-subunit dehydrogenase